MIIISQDKDVIVNFDNVENIWINNPLENDNGLFEIRAESYSNNMIIGEYATEERAKEVLVLIYKTYADQTLIKHIRGDIQTALIEGDPNKYFDVFEMPQE